MIAFAKRNLKLFFRDKSAVFFSLLSVFIIILLYVLFLGDVSSQNMPIPDARQLMDCWIMAGLVAVTSVTATMGSFEVMVSDKAKRIVKDFSAAPIRRSGLAGGYILSSYAIGVILSVVALGFMQGYLLYGGGELLSAEAAVKALGLILLATFSNTSMLLFFVSFIGSANAFATASTIIGTMIGFLTGIYIPIGVLPAAIQVIVKLFPVSHVAVLFRQILMADRLQAIPGGSEVLQEIKEELGVVFVWNGRVISAKASLLIVVGAGLLFALLSAWRLSKKKK